MPRFNPAKANHNRRISREDAFWINRKSLPTWLTAKDIKTAKDGRRYYLVDGKVNFIKGSKPAR